MAKVNYNFEKRQKEIARKKKHDQKQAEKRARKTTGEGDKPADDGATPTE